MTSTLKISITIIFISLLLVIILLCRCELIDSFGFFSSIFTIFDICSSRHLFVSIDLSLFISGYRCIPYLFLLALSSSLFCIPVAPLFLFCDVANHCTLLLDLLFSATLPNFHQIQLTFFSTSQLNPIVIAIFDLLPLQEQKQ